MRYISELAFFVSYFFAVTSAAVPSCKSLIEVGSLYTKSDRPFDPAELDSEIPILKRRADFLRKKNLLNGLNSGQFSLSLKSLRPMLLVAEKELEKVSFFESNSHPIRTLNLRVRAAFLKNKVQRYLQRPDHEEFSSVTEVSSLFLDVVILVSEWDSIAHTKQQYKFPTEDRRSQFLMSSMPMIGSPHPETILYLASRHLFVWEYATRGRIVDGQDSPYIPAEIAQHDNTHISVISGYFLKTPVNESRLLFDTIWSEFINRPQQTFRERELAIFIVFYSFFEFRMSSMSWTLQDLRSHLKYISSSLSRRFPNGLFTRLTNKNDITSDILKERPVEKSEIKEVASKMILWVDSQLAE